MLLLTLKDRLTSDFKDAMKAKDEIKKNTINLARAAIKQYEVDNREELDDQGVLNILTKQVKMRKDALSDFKKAGRTDLLDNYNREIEILMEYLPKQLTEAEITEIVKATAADMGIESGKQNLGKLIGAVMPKVKGVADGGDVKKVIEAFLS
ncbi:GatB/YqeY domain-containing protein [Anaerovorax odorimutans]